MRLRTLLLLTSALLLLSACGAAAGQSRPAQPDDGGSGTVTVFAAASLRDAFTEIAQAFEDAHPRATVTLNLAGSQQLATQIIDGAPADVFASADLMQMDRVTAAGLTVDGAEVFARNRLAIAVEPGNPTSVTTLDDLARDDLTVVVAADNVPAGRYARQALRTAGVSVTPASLENDVRAVLTKVALGEADAGVVYVSDAVAAADRVQQVAIPDDANVTATYPIAVLRDATQPSTARTFVDIVRSEVGQQALRRAGFLAASGPASPRTAPPAAPVGPTP